MSKMSVHDAKVAWEIAKQYQPVINLLQLQIETKTRRLTMLQGAIDNAFETYRQLKDNEVTAYCNECLLPFEKLHNEHYICNGCEARKLAKQEQ